MNLLTRILYSLARFFLIEFILSSVATMLKSSNDDLPRIILTSIPDCDAGESDDPLAPPALIDGFGMRLSPLDGLLCALE